MVMIWLCAIRCCKTAAITKLKTDKQTKKLTILHQPAIKIARFRLLHSKNLAQTSFERR